MSIKWVPLIIGAVVFATTASAEPQGGLSNGTPNTAGLKPSSTPASSGTRNNTPLENIQNIPKDINKGVQDILSGRAPGPAILGTIGGTRVCIPWC